MPDLDIFVGAIMGKIIVLELPEPCRGDLCGFLRILAKYVYMICQKWTESGRGKRSRADTLGK